VVVGCSRRTRRRESCVEDTFSKQQQEEYIYYIFFFLLLLFFSSPLSLWTKPITVVEEKGKTIILLLKILKQFCVFGFETKVFICSRFLQIAIFGYFHLGPTFFSILIPFGRSLISYY
jgi:hypothetical protein